MTMDAYEWKRRHTLRAAMDSLESLGMKWRDIYVMLRDRGAGRVVEFADNCRTGKEQVPA